MKSNIFYLLAIAALALVTSCKDDDKTDTDPGDTDNNTGLTFTDSRDSKTYKYVQIGAQYWMAEDLAYQGGTDYCYDDNATNCTTYSVLYDSLAAASACPAGWHLPTDAEFRTLEKTIGFSDADTAVAGASRGNATSLKAGGSTGFNMNKYVGYWDGAYFSKDDNTYYWLQKGWWRSFRTTQNDIFRPSGATTNGNQRMCVRCLKD